MKSFILFAALLGVCFGALQSYSTTYSTFTNDWMTLQSDMAVNLKYGYAWTTEQDSSLTTQHWNLYFVNDYSFTFSFEFFGNYERIVTITFTAFDIKPFGIQIQRSTMLDDFTKIYLIGYYEYTFFQLASAVSQSLTECKGSFIDAINGEDAFACAYDADDDDDFDVSWAAYTATTKNEELFNVKLMDN